MSAYARPGVGRRGARAALAGRRRRARGRHRPRGPDRPRDQLAVAPRRPPGRGARRASTPTAPGVRIGATATLAEVARSSLVAPYAAVATAARLAASPLLRNQGTVGGNLCQHTRCWYYRGEEWTCWLGGGDTCYAQIGEHRKHNLEPGDCISAHPSDLAPALAAVRRDRRARALRAASGSCRCSTSTGARRTTTARSSCSSRASSSLPCGCRRRPTHRPISARGERQAFSFPLVSVAAARRGDELRSSQRGWRTSRARSTRPIRSPACRGTRRAPGSAPCSRRSSNGRSAQLSSDGCPRSGGAS